MDNATLNVPDLKTQHHSRKKAVAHESAPGSRKPRHATAALASWMLAILLISFAATCISGIGLWWCVDYEPADILEASAWPQRWRLLHGWSLPATLVTIGMILRSHVFKGFQLGKNRASGILLMAVLLWLVISGWGLYYGTEEASRSLFHGTHVWAGFGLVGLFAAHWLLGLRSRTN